MPNEVLLEPDVMTSKLDGLAPQETWMREALEIFELTSVEDAFADTAEESQNAFCNTEVN